MKGPRSRLRGARKSAGSAPPAAGGKHLQPAAAPSRAGRQVPGRRRCDLAGRAWPGRSTQSQSLDSDAGGARYSDAQAVSVPALRRPQDALLATTGGLSGSIPLQRRGDRARLRRPCVMKRLSSGDEPEYRPCGVKVTYTAAAETAAELRAEHCMRTAGQGSPLSTERQLDRSAVTT